MPEQTITERVIAIISDKLDTPENEITIDADIREDLGADFLDCIELTMSFEEEFNVEISDEDAESIHTVQDAIDFLSSKTRSGKP